MIGRTGAVILACVLVATARAAAAGADEEGEPSPPPPPAACRVVEPGAALAALLEAAAPGDAFCLAPGSHPGPLRVPAGVTIHGPRAARIHSRGTGSTVSLDGPGAALGGVSVDGSGGRFDLLDAAVRVTADDVRVEGVRVEGALFGILVERAHRVVLRGNEVVGDPSRPLGLRGDGIRLWEVRDSRVEHNRLRDSRDLVVWYSPGNRFVGNRVRGGRYGTHFMYSHGNVLLDNRYERNVVGVFVMYSRDLEVRRNLIAESAGAAGVGLGAKESGALRVVENLFLGNAVGIYLDTSPLDLRNRNRFERNVLRLGDTAVVFHGGAGGNAFRGNSFRDNRQQVRVEGRGDATDADWRGNDFDDYAGYDLDGDGVGDVPYELRSLSGELVARRPSLAFLRGSPALGLVEVLGRAVPLFQARTLLVDPAPRMAALRPEELRAD